MTITQDNYFSTIDEVDVATLPKAMQQAHEQLVLHTDGGNNWEALHQDEQLEELAGVCFEKLSEYVSAHSLNGANEHSIEETFIEQFLSLDKRTVSKQEVATLLKELQTAIGQKRIRKSSAYADRIIKIQDLLIGISNKKTANITIKLDASLKNFLKINNEKKDKKTLEQRAKKQKGKGVGALLGVSEENIAESITKGSQTPKTHTLMSSKEFTNLKFSTIGFKGKWKEFIGDPSEGFSVMVYGRPKMGKSYLCVELAGYLARNHGRVLYVAKEEKLDATLQKKLKDKDVAHEQLFVSDFLPQDLAEYRFIFLDSVNKLGLSPKDLEQLQATNKGKSFIYIFQTTKSGHFRGNNEFQHHVDVVVELPEKGKAVQYGRFNQGGELQIFSETTENTEKNDLRVSKSDAMLDGIKNSNMKRKSKFPEWTKPKHLSKSDHKDLQLVYEFFEKGDIKSAQNIAFHLDTIVRDEIPSDIWIALGGKVIGKTPNKQSNERLSIEDDIFGKMGSNPSLTNLTNLSSRKPVDINSVNVYDVKSAEVLNRLPIVGLKDYPSLKDPLDQFPEQLKGKLFILLYNGKYYYIDTQGYAYARYVLELKNFNPDEPLNGKPKTSFSVKEQNKLLDAYESENDDLNPRFVFTTTASKVLSTLLKGKLNTEFLIRRELANRGQDENGKWVGFPKAKEIHGLIEK